MATTTDFVERRFKPTETQESHPKRVALFVVVGGFAIDGVDLVVSPYMEIKPNQREIDS
jgi:hypothetical protein